MSSVPGERDTPRWDRNNDDFATSPRSNDARMELADALMKTGNEDRRAFRDLYVLTSAKLFGICLRICGERSAAEDVFHDVYVTIWRRAGAWEPGRSSPITWLATIARNRAIDWRRAQGKRPATPLENAGLVIDPAPDQATVASARQEVGRLHTCLDKLDPRQATAIRIAFFHGLSYRELAERDGVPLGTTKSMIRRGLAQLKLQLDELK